MTVTLVQLQTPGMPESLLAAGFVYHVDPSGIHFNDEVGASAFAASYPGSATELTWWKTQKQAELDAFFDANFDISAFIRGGTAVGLTGVQVGTFFATITNNYRGLRSSISSAASVAAVSAINVRSGWPNNP